MFYYANIFQAMMHGPHLVFDFSFEEHLTEKELKDLMRQIYNSHGMNKLAKEPFHFHFCSIKQSSSTSQKLLKAFPNMAEIPITVSEQSYLDLYPREKLVYLSPNATEVMANFDHDLVYIIGAIVDKAVETPLTMAKAKREKIRMMKFPLDRYVKWSSGSKALALNHVVDILLHLKTSQNWNDALTKCLPKRKFDPTVSEKILVKNNNNFLKKKTNGYGSYVKRAYPSLSKDTDT
ncbi:hypothetical protein HELRODRAFT_68039 [Helobdella robusta]|uniref:RNA (guanine-9-)-methyltransferase domain-containing protein 1 n=1 Tax=Helobdella robusta TaxID=6412 RepID=T1FZ94_HELRO|nr:hypothetical protein HELRODRAFT_68039 [Helobdella robusta]ESN96417.1 hypothetical protein HELRODRAFT_68039 [Helobdella robusta]